MPNVRGSWGYGIDFAQSIDGHFGIEPTHDVLTGIEALGVDSRYLAPPPGGIESLKPQQYLGLQRAMNAWIRKEFETPTGTGVIPPDH